MVVPVVQDDYYPGCADFIIMSNCADTKNLLRGVDGLAGATINTGSAINAFVRVDERYTIDIRDRAFGAFTFASAAVEAGIGINYMSHELSPFGSSNYGSDFTRVKSLREEYHNWIK